MSTGSSKILAQVQLGFGLADIYVPPQGAGNVVAGTTALWICNTDTLTRLITLRVGTGVLTAANALFEAVPIRPKTTWILNESEWGLTLKSGQKIQGFADVGAKVTVTLFGQEVI